MRILTGFVWHLIAHLINFMILTLHSVKIVHKIVLNAKALVGAKFAIQIICLT
jgi:hypothetical protein